MTTIVALGAIYALVAEFAIIDEVIVQAVFAIIHEIPVAAVFIAQAVGMDLTLANQFTIVATAVLASIGTAAVPGAGIIMLIIILEAINVPSEGIALILGVDRILDMIRTATNVTGDATVASVMDSLER